MYFKSSIHFAVAIALFSQLSARAAETLTATASSEVDCASKKEKSELDLVTQAARMKAITNAEIFTDRKISDLDTLDGPQLKKETLPNDSTVDCEWQRGKDGSAGRTPKFHCKFIKATAPDGTVYLPKDVSASDRAKALAGLPPDTQVKETKITNLKIRYGTGYLGHKAVTEVIADRLEWALGFGSDVETPIKTVNCIGCTKDPYHQAAKSSGSASFARASAEASMPGKGIYVQGTRYSMDTGKDQPAWMWSELDKITDPAKKAQVDALKLFEAFLKNPDNKTIQNKLICKTKLDANGECPEPALYVHDLGASFGSDTHKRALAFTEPDPLDIKKWTTAPVWKGGTSCTALLNMVSMNGPGLVNPTISEAGRALLAGKLSELISDQNVSKLKDMFVAAHVENFSDHGHSDSADQWVEAFKTRAHMIIDHHCSE